MADVQPAVEHTADTSCAVAVCSLSPKLSPLTVTDDRPLLTLFVSTPNDATGASKLNASDAVPTTPPTVTCTARITSYTLPSASHSPLLLAAHATDVADVQPAVEHTADTSCAVAVYSTYRKLSPLTVTDDRPLATVFKPTYDATGASKENTPYPVPTTPPTVSSTVCESSKCALIRHTTDDDELHCVVLHAAAPTAAVAVYMLLPKLSPATVTDPLPLGGPFSTTPDTTAESNENTPARPGSYVYTAAPVPLSAPTVTSTYPVYP